MIGNYHSLHQCFTISGVKDKFDIVFNQTASHEGI